MAHAPAPAAMSYGSSTTAQMKNEMLKHIDGELPGSPPMTGVTTHHYSRNQKLYLDDFKEVTANKVMHPYVNTTVCGNQIDSSPHNLITGTNYAPPMAVSSNGMSLWQSESSRAWNQKSYLNTVSRQTCGMRTDQLVFDAKYVN